MIVDAIDAQGRRYLEVRVFPEGKLKQAFAEMPHEHCIECNALVHHGFDRYFQRNNPDDGSIPRELESLLLEMTYDTVCGPCGDRLLRKDSV